MPRSQGGSHEVENLLLLWSGHHAALHRGEIQIVRPAATAISDAEGLEPVSPNIVIEIVPPIATSPTTSAMVRDTGSRDRSSRTRTDRASST